MNKRKAFYFSFFTGKTNFCDADECFFVSESRGGELKFQVGSQELYTEQWRDPLEGWVMCNVAREVHG